MGKLTGYEKVALLLTVFFLAVCVAVCCVRGAERGSTVTVSDRSPEQVFRTQTGLQPDGTPDSLIPGERINVNTAPHLDLARLPGIGDTRAQAIVAYREENGPFRSAQELLLVKGIGDATLEKLLPYIELG